MQRANISKKIYGLSVSLVTFGSFLLLGAALLVSVWCWHRFQNVQIHFSKGWSPTTGCYFVTH